MPSMRICRAPAVAGMDPQQAAGCGRERIICASSVPHCDATNRVQRERLGHGREVRQPASGSCCRAIRSSSRRRTSIAMSRATICRVVVDFWAPWCGPCRMMAPAYEQAAAQLATQARIAKLDTESQPDERRPASAYAAYRRSSRSGTDAKWRGSRAPWTCPACCSGSGPAPEPWCIAARFFSRKMSRH